MKECIGVVAGCSGDAITEALQKRGYEVALVAGAKGESGIGRTDYYTICDLRKQGEIKDFLQRHSVQKVIMGTGHILAIELMDYLEKNGFVTSINASATKVAKHKTKYRELLQKIGVPNAKFIGFDRNNIPSLEFIVETVGLPCVIKSPNDFMYPQKANTIEELRAAIHEVTEKDNDVLVEQYFYGMDYTLAVTNDGKKATAYTIAYYSKAKDVQLKGFTEVYEGKMTLEQEAEAKKIAEKAVWEAGLLGLPRLDMITTLEGKHYILECNEVTVTGWDTPYVPWTRGTLRVVPESYVDLLVDTSMTIFEEKLKSF